MLKFYAVFHLSFSQVLISLLLTASRDPGIIPRDSSKEAFELLFVSSTRQPIEEIVNGKVVKRKYCDTCRHHRPLRCSHCSICNNCIDRFDHHCPWIGQCIGRVCLFFGQNTKIPKFWKIPGYPHVVLLIMYYRGEFWWASNKIWVFRCFFLVVFHFLTCCFYL